MKKRMYVISCVIFLVAMMIFAKHALTGKWADTPTDLDLEILAVYQFWANSTSEANEAIKSKFSALANDTEANGFKLPIIIVGYNFNNGATPITKFAGRTCELVEGPIEICIHEGKTLWGMVVECNPFICDDDATLPSNGTYLLTVQTGSSTHQYDTFNVYLTSLI